MQTVRRLFVLKPSIPDLPARGCLFRRVGAATLFRPLDHILPPLPPTINPDTSQIFHLAQLLPAFTLVAVIPPVVRGTDQHNPDERRFSPLQRHRLTARCWR